MLRIGERVTITECCCHESVQPRHTGCQGELCQVACYGSPGDPVLFLLAVGDATCYAGTVEPEMLPAGGKAELQP